MPASKAEGSAPPVRSADLRRLTLHRFEFRSFHALNCCKAKPFIFDVRSLTVAVADDRRVAR